MFCIRKNIYSHRKKNLLFVPCNMAAVQNLYLSKQTTYMNIVLNLVADQLLNIQRWPHHVKNSKSLSKINDNLNISWNTPNAVFHRRAFILLIK